MTCLGVRRLTLFLCLLSSAAVAVCASMQNSAPQQAPAPTQTAPQAQPSQQPPEETAPAPPTPAPAPPKPQFFGGTVTQLDSTHITVSRTPAGKATERRTFVINGNTKMTKAVKVRSHVTVRYQHLPEGDVALEVRIRPLRTPRAS